MASSNILHYRILYLSKYKSKSVIVDPSYINYNVLDAYNVKQIVVISITTILSDIFGNILSTDKLSYIDSKDISKSIISSGNNSIHKSDKINDFFSFSIYIDNNKSIS